MQRALHNGLLWDQNLFALFSDGEVSETCVQAEEEAKRT
jgi:hypothetical protein